MNTDSLNNDIIATILYTVTIGLNIGFSLHNEILLPNRSTGIIYCTRAR